MVAFLKVNPCNQSAWIWLADLIEHKYLNAIKHKVLLNDLLPDLLIDGFVKAGLGNHQIVEFLSRVKQLMVNGKLKPPKQNYFQRLV